MRKIIFLVLFSMVFSVSFSNHVRSVKDSTGVTKIDGKLHIKYLVSPGETIYRISTKYGVSISDLMEINPELENGLKVGQIINIPYNPEMVKKSEEPKRTYDENQIVHTVQPGETFYGLAKKYNTSVSELLKNNNMELKAGQQIIIGRKDAVNTSAAASGTTTDKTSAPPVQEKKETAQTSPIVKEEKKSAPPAETEKVASSTDYKFDPTRKQVLIIPFDPYLYFSDADDEIAARSNIQRTKVRQVFRKRLNTLIRHEGYENIHLLGGKAVDSLTDLNKVYSSVTYNYHEVLYNPHYQPEVMIESGNLKKTNKSWLEKQKEKITSPQAVTGATFAKDEGKYFGVIVKDPNFFEYFKSKYDVDYYIFINQFEVKTNYENCLDRAALNYERTFTTHFSIFDANGKQIAGNKFRTHYNSNTNDIYQIVGDNMSKIAKRILQELPPPDFNN